MNKRTVVRAPYHGYGISRVPFSKTMQQSEKVMFQFICVHNMVSLILARIITSTQAMSFYYDSCYWNCIMDVVKSSSLTRKYFTFVCAPFIMLIASL